MVLASNEWLSDCDDDQRSAATNTTTVTTTTTTTSSTAAAGITTATSPTNNTTTATVSGPRSTVNSTILPNIVAASTLPATTTTEPRNDNDYNRQTINDSVHQQSINDNSELLLQEIRLSMLNPNGIEIMADENTSETLKDGSANSETEIIKADGTHDSVTNNNTGYISDESLNSSSSPPDNMVNSSSNASLNSSINSNTNPHTLETEIVLQAQANAAWADAVANKEALPLSSPITPQALSSALQSVMNATTNANVAASNLQNNFLSSLGIEELGLRETAKQLASSFLESAAAGKPQTNLNNSQLSVTSDSDNNGQAKIVLLCEATSHPFQTRTILLTPNIECKVGRLIAKSKASESNAIFDCKVLSRNHAVLWYSDDGKFWVKDTKSSNGTFINESKLGIEGYELHFGDVLKFGVDVLENSRKEVHGCIIAYVKLYLPDGREAISIDSLGQRSQHSGEGRISYDEMHRLNLYMQEASQREKVLKSKLFNIQNVLDATRKNSALCWQSLIAEDQLLHRIHSLEKKLQVMEKNVPESALRNEILKLLEDKNSYQLTAKEALRKVYQERCDAMQMLAKVESAYASSDNECKILRDQIMNSKQALQDMNARLQHLETDFNEYKDEAERKQQEAKEQEEQRILELTEKLQLRELECSELKRRISDLLIRRAELLDDEEKLQEQQAFEKLDAAIADMDLGEDDDDEDEAEEPNVKNNLNIASKKKRQAELLSGSGNKHDSANVLNDSSNSSGGSEKGKIVSHLSDNDDEPPQKEAKEKVAKESTIMKWLQNSDLNTKEGSLDIFKAICNESDSSDEPEANSPGVGDGANANKHKLVEDFDKKCVNFTNKLKNVQINLRQLEAEIANETTKVSDAISSLDDGSTAVAMDSDEDEDTVLDKVAKRNGQLNDLLAKDNQSYLLLKRSVNMLREAYNDICDSVKQQQEQMYPKINSKETTSLPAITVKTQFENYSPHKPSNSAVKKLETQETLKPLLEAVNEDEPDTDEDDDIDEDEISDAATQHSGSSRNTIREAKSCTHVCGDDICEYKKQIEELSSKLVQIENDSQNTLEIMQIECDSFKDKVSDMSKLIETLRLEKEALELAASENTGDPSSSVSNMNKSDTGDMIECVEVVTVTTTTTTKSSASFDQQMNEDLEEMNTSAVQREEELIMYKERLEQTQTDNMSLRKEVAQLKLKSYDHNQTLVKRVLPYGAAVIAILVYFVTTYY